MSDIGSLRSTLKLHETTGVVFQIEESEFCSSASTYQTSGPVENPGAQERDRHAFGPTRCGSGPAQHQPSVLDVGFLCLEEHAALATQQEVQGQTRFLPVPVRPDRPGRPGLFPRAIPTVRPGCPGVAGGRSADQSGGLWTSLRGAGLCRSSEGLEAAKLDQLEGLEEGRRLPSGEELIGGGAGVQEVRTVRMALS